MKEPIDLFEAIRFVTIPVSSIHVDQAYQRILDRKRAGQIARNFEAKLYNVLILSRRSDGRVYCIDGQTRLDALCQLGRQSQRVPALMHTGLSQPQEADLFMSLQNLRKPLTPFDKYRAALVKGDEHAMRIKAVLDRLSLRAVGHTDGSPDAISSVSTLFEVEKFHGAEMLQRVLHMAKESWPQDGIHGRSKNMLDGLTAFIVTHASKGTPVKDDHFIRAMRTTDAASFMRAAAASKGNRAVYQYLASDLTDTYNKSAPRGIRVSELPINAYTKRPRRPSQSETREAISA